MVHNLSEVVRQFKQAWTNQLEDQALEQVCLEQGLTWRNTLLNPVVTLKEGKLTKKHRQPLIDGTLLGPDHLAELVAYHLHRLGVAKAELVVFVSDGARWIWDRLDWIQRRAGLDPSRIVHVLDFCHAAHHISLALKALGLEETQRRETYGRLRKLLKRSRYDQVVEQLEKLARGQPEDSDVWNGDGTRQTPPAI